MYVCQAASEVDLLLGRDRERERERDRETERQRDRETERQRGGREVFPA